MLEAIALLLQAAAPAPLMPERIDLTKLLGDARCDRAADEEEIVVCARRPLKDPYRLERLPETYDEKPLRAETMIGPVKAGVVAESATVGGFTSNRAMIRFKLPF